MIRFFSRYWSRQSLFSLVVEVTLLFIAVPLATFLRLGVGPGTPPPAPVQALQSSIFTLGLLLCFYVNGLYDLSERITERQLFVRLLRSFTIAAVVLWALYFVVPDVQVGRGVMALSLLFALVAIAAWRALLPSILKAEGLFADRVLIVGTDEKAIDIAREILARKHLGYRIVGFLDDDPSLQGVSLLNPRVVGTTRQARELALQNAVTRVIVAPGDFRGRVSMDALLECKTSGIRVQEGSAYYEQLTGKIMLEGLRKSWLVFSEGFVVSRGTLFAKRLLDLVAATAGLVVAAPLLALTALTVRLESPGPVLFRQERVGRGGEVFTLWKFRSMRQDAEKVGVPQWAAKQDPRVTRVGRFLRTTRLDELPQLWNVLVGDMSLVGPRPERQHFVSMLVAESPFYEQRLVVRPGLTGWAQIKAPYASSFEESLKKLKYDLYYIKNMSVFLDLSILLSTARTVLLGRGAR